MSANNDGTTTCGDKCPICGAGTFNGKASIDHCSRRYVDPLWCDEVGELRDVLAERTSERDDAARVLHGRAIAGSQASKGPTEFAYVEGRFAGTAYCTGERWIAFDRHGTFLAADLTLDDALERCRDDERGEVPA